ncbi:hypothetical protein DiNV_CH01M_ORF107 [Drosophila innubila nudivirus]|uniref:Uncharacterized protein n=1 Tax=Drosophila innubila nudivirus TaxID=2057187 RepID=A0A2H4UXB7_9VIRU|nr:hypothetical protein DiNV_CH01M_ORF107 [Drosophila innubila nudivirus]ATZ81554.1 hypothetical protein DiNV_CH01M_ORF107 [Drosophila innubila nudivirus]
MATTNNLPNGRDIQNIPSYNIRYDVQGKNNNNMDYEDDGYACQVLSKIAIAVIVIIFIILIIVAITSKSMPTIYVVAPPTAKNRNNMNGNSDIVDGSNTIAAAAADDDDDDGGSGSYDDDNNDGSNNKIQKINKNKIRKRRQTRKNPIDNFNINDDTNNRHGDNIDGSINQ